MDERHSVTKDFNLLHVIRSIYFLHSRDVLQVMITAGGNQAFAMVALALLDPGDRVLLVRNSAPNTFVFCAYLFCAIAGDRDSHLAG